MAGKLCFGSAYNNAGSGHLRSSKAFCEGMGYRASGTSVTKPKANSPHVAGSEAALAWALGWDFASASAGSSIDSTGTCCSVVGFVLG